jgi:transcriptional regulator with XRE-family HTH domain
MTIGSRVRELREDRDLSVIELVAMAGVSRDALIKLEEGHERPTAATLHSLAEALGVTIGELA